MDEIKELKDIETKKVTGGTHLPLDKQREYFQRLMNMDIYCINCRKRLEYTDIAAIESDGYEFYCRGCNTRQVAKVNGYTVVSQKRI